MMKAAAPCIGWVSLSLPGLIRQSISVVRQPAATMACAASVIAAQPAMANETQNLVTFQSSGKNIPLVYQGKAATVVRADNDATVVHHAADDLISDIALVTGVHTSATNQLPTSAKSAIIIGTLGHSAIVDRIVAERKIDVSRLKGAWESFIITTVARPSAGVEQALLVIGSDRRGTAYGTYEISQSMGVSPWSWWSDVTPQHHDSLYVSPGTMRFGPPSVRYRGIFINDEDWGLFPWASKTYDPTYGDIGPKTYRKVFELLLRLRANTLWPAMHKVTQSFNINPENARLADEYGIVMGSSHAEPMLRSNPGEWKAPAAQFNYAINPGGVRDYWEERVKSNAKYESFWTLGMRGIHDSAIVGANTDQERVELLNKIIADERDLLRRHIDPKLSGVQQMFVPYKEVLDIYRAGLKIPQDVTIVWPDDNHGYIRQFPNAAEKTRSGGAGIYYHLSYLGAPLSYLWLSTTPPALVMEEMTRAYDEGVRQVWIANIGDIKPSEIDMSLFLDMAWDINRWRGKSQTAFLTDWSSKTFGEQSAKPIAAALNEYYSLNYEQRPEFIGTPAMSTNPGLTPLSTNQVNARLRRFSDLAATSKSIAQTMPPSLSDAYFELVDYPVRASAAANLRNYATERYAQLIDSKPTMARSAAGAALIADTELKTLTRRFNEEVAGGKWQNMMSVEPADNQWKRFRVAQLSLPNPGVANDPKLFLDVIGHTEPNAGATGVEAENAAPAKGWRFIEGLGRGKGSMLATEQGASLDLTVVNSESGPRSIRLDLLPLFSNALGGTLEVTVSIDGGPPRVVSIPRSAYGGERMGGAERSGDLANWSQGVLDNLLQVSTGLTIPLGQHRLTIKAISTGIAIDRLVMAAP